MTNIYLIVAYSVGAWPLVMARVGTGWAVVTEDYVSFSIEDAMI